MFAALYLLLLCLAGYGMIAAIHSQSYGKLSWYQAYTIALHVVAIPSLLYCVSVFVKG